MGCCQTKGRALQDHTLCKALVKNRTGVHRGGLKYAKSRENWSKEQDASVQVPASEHLIQPKIVECTSFQDLPGSTDNGLSPEYSVFRGLGTGNTKVRRESSAPRHEIAVELQDRTHVEWLTQLL